MRTRSERQDHPWDKQLGELSVTGRVVGYVYFRVSRGGLEWSAERPWRLSRVQDAWIETEEWFITPDGEISAYAGDNVGPEAAFHQLEAGKYSAPLTRLDPVAAKDADPSAEVDVDFRWMTYEEREPLLNRLRAR